MAKRKFPFYGLLILGPLFLGACTFARIYSTSGNQVSLTETNPKGGEHFKFSDRSVFDYTGAFDVQDLLAERYGSGNEVQNVTIKVKYDVLDFLLNLVTITLAQSKTFEISGDIIRR